MLGHLSLKVFLLCLSEMSCSSHLLVGPDLPALRVFSLINNGWAVELKLVVAEEAPAPGCERIGVHCMSTRHFDSWLSILVAVSHNGVFLCSGEDQGKVRQIDRKSVV